jgi:FAD/FMN-containing dehydrogenase
MVLRLIEGRQEAVIQDVEVPIEHAPQFATFFNATVWICPVRVYDPAISYPLYQMNPQQLFVNFGFWDTVGTVHDEGYYNKIIEAKVDELHGKKSLYSNSFYSREAFGRLYNEPAYRRLKTRYDPAGKLKDLYNKCVLKQ